MNIFFQILSSYAIATEDKISPPRHPPRPQGIPLAPTPTYTVLIHHKPLWNESRKAETSVLLEALPSHSQ
jgi:hypothetical protein